MADVVGNTAIQMANAPLGGKASEKTNDAQPKRKGNPILAVLGVPTFVMGDGRTYPRTTGFGPNRKAHPDGGTNETVAFIVWKPFQGCDTITQEGRIYCEKFLQDGQKKRSFSISLPFLKSAPRDAVARQTIEQVKVALRDAYRIWSMSDAAKDAPKKTETADKWIETDPE
jgi:hypothetical protein